MLKAGAINYHAQLGLTGKDTIINRWYFNGWDIEPLGLLNDLALGCYQPTSEVCIVYKYSLKQNVCQSNSSQTIL